VKIRYASFCCFLRPMPVSSLQVCLQESPAVARVTSDSPPPSELEIAPFDPPTPKILPHSCQLHSLARYAHSQSTARLVILLHHECTADTVVTVSRLSSAINCRPGRYADGGNKRQTYMPRKQNRTDYRRRRSYSDFRGTLRGWAPGYNKDT